MLMELLCACGLMSSLTIVSPEPATPDEVCMFSFVVEESEFNDFESVFTDP